MKDNKLSILIVTPNLNGARFLKDCIESIQRQDYPAIKHVVIDGGSTDESLEILKRYSVDYEIVPELNNYEAIHYGFEKYPSDIQAWLNADDIYRDGALYSVMQIFNTSSHVWWLTGLPSLTDSTGRIKPITSLPCPLFSKYFYLQGRRKYIQQESTFWRSKLYTTVNGLSTDYKYANDYFLWFSFFKHTKLYTLPQILASFREHGGGQISVKNREKYKGEVEDIIAKNKIVLNPIKIWVIKILLFFDFIILNTPKIRGKYMKSKFRQKFLAFAPLITFQNADVKVL